MITKGRVKMKIECAFTEVLDIINHLEIQASKKIPHKFIEYLEKNMDTRL